MIASKKIEWAVFLQPQSPHRAHTTQVHYGITRLTNVRHRLINMITNYCGSIPFDITVTLYLEHCLDCTLANTVVEMRSKNKIHQW